MENIVPILSSATAERHDDDLVDVINEVSAARVCLLNPQQKQAYDQQLRASVASDPLSPLGAAADPLGINRSMPTEPVSAASPQKSPAPVQINAQAGSSGRALWKNPAVLGLAITGVLGLALVLVLVFAMGNEKTV